MKEAAKMLPNPFLHCPHCNGVLPKDEHICPKCNVHVGIAAVEEANRIQTAVIQPKQPATPEALFPHLGDYLHKKGLVTQQALDLTLAYQRELATRGKPALLGQLLVDSGMINQTELDIAITEQIIHLKTALENSNLELESRVTQRTAELEEALMRLGELDQMKVNFIANVSHELRTPLSHLVGYLDLICNRNLGPLTLDQKEVLTGMTQASKRLWTLIEDLLQFSAASTGNMALNPRPFPIMEPVKTAVLNKKPQATQRQIFLKANIMPDLPLVHADQEKITWVIEQLLDNAIKFTPSNGRVAAYARKKDDEVQIDVIDTGIGIPKERINELFCSFHQLENFSTRRYEGMGLGLTMAQKIIAAHGSEIRVRSRVGVGSRFAFKLPIHP